MSETIGVTKLGLLKNKKTNSKKVEIVEEKKKVKREDQKLNKGAKIRTLFNKLENNLETTREPTKGTELGDQAETRSDRKECIDIDFDLDKHERELNNF